MSDKKLYATIGVDVKAAAEEIKKAFKSLAGVLHPDKETGDALKNQRADFVKKQHLFEQKLNRARYDATGDDNQFKDNTAELRSQLAQIFLSVVESERKGDLVDLVKNIITSKVDALKNQRADFVKKQHLFEQKLNRVINKSGENLYHGVINQQIEHIKKNIIAVDDAVAKGDALIIMLETYEDTNPDVMERSGFNNVQFAPGQWGRIGGLSGGIP